MSTTPVININDLPKATHTGVLTFGPTKITCANLPNEVRVISESGLTNAITGRTGGASPWMKRDDGEALEIPYFLRSKRLKPYARQALDGAHFLPIYYTRGEYQVIKAYDSSVLPDVCNIWITARKAGALTERDLIKAERAEGLLLAIAKVGIIALIDEATGYQASRDKTELQTLLSKYLSDYQLDWAKMFPNAFYKEIFRLHDWKFDGSKQARPMLVGKITADVVYERLPDNVLEILREKNPVVNKETHQREATHHQFLSKNIGQPHLRQRLSAIIALMRVSETWADFIEMLDRAFPKHPTVFVENED